MGNGSPAYPVYVAVDTVLAQRQLHLEALPVLADHSGHFTLVLYATGSLGVMVDLSPVTLTLKLEGSCRAPDRYAVWHADGPTITLNLAPLGAAVDPSLVTIRLPW